MINKASRTAATVGKDWRRELFTTLAAYRETPHTVTGYSPATMMFNRIPRGKLPESPGEVNENEHMNIEQERRGKDKQKEYADRKRHCKEHTFQEGDVVLVKQQKKNKL